MLSAAVAQRAAVEAEGVGAEEVGAMGADVAAGSAIWSVGSWVG